MVSVDRIRAHFTRCVESINAQVSAGLGSYLNQAERASFRELDREEAAALLQPSHFLSAFETSELAVDTRTVASALSNEVSDHQRILFRGAARVTAVAEKSQRFFVALTGQTRSEGPYDAVVNALWEGRLAIDKSMGMEAQRTPMYRHKFGSRVLIPLAASDVPSLTVILGPFGDIVNYGPGGMYLSWYPTGMVDSTTEMETPVGWIDRPQEARISIFRESYQAWLKLCPPLADLQFGVDQIDPVSGIIFAWGATDIDNPDSELHERHSIGISSRGHYHSVNTGKYTTAPMLALQVARRVMTGAE